MTVEPAYKDDTPDDPVRIDPHRMTNFRTAESRDTWDERISSMSWAKTVAEWRSVLDPETNRDAAIIHVSHHNRDRWLEDLTNAGLKYRKIRYTKPYGGYSHKHFPTDKSDPERITYAAVAESESVLDDMEDAEHSEDYEHKHRTVGKHLGFPDCCLDFFNDVWLGGKIDPMYEAACNSDCAEAVDGDRETIRLTNPNPGANAIWRYIGLGFVTHLPCSFDCEGTVEVARDRYRVMAENGYQDEADWMAEWLSMPHEWTGYHGLARVANRHLIASSTTSSYWGKKTIVWGSKPTPEVNG